MKLIFSMVFLILLSSCGSTGGTGVDYYFEAAAQCDRDNKVPAVNADGTVETKDGEAVMVIQKGFCDEEWDKYDRAEERKERKAAYDRLTSCPGGQVFICRDRWCSQERRHRPTREPTRTDMVKSRCGFIDEVFRQY